MANILTEGLLPVATGGENKQTFNVGEVVNVRGYEWAGTVVTVNGDATFNIQIPGEIPEMKKAITLDRLTRSTKPVGKQAPPSKPCGSGCLDCCTCCFDFMSHCCCYCEDNKVSTLLFSSFFIFKDLELCNLINFICVSFLLYYSQVKMLWD